VAAGEAAGVARCLPRVAPLDRTVAGAAARTARGSPDGPLPFGAGLFVAAALGGGPPDDPTLVTAWWDPVAGAVVVTATGAVSGATRGEGRLELGAAEAHHVALAVTPSGRVALAFQDPDREVLRYAEADGPRGPFAVETVGPGGAWAELTLDGSGAPRILHGDGRSGTVSLSARAGGCWGATTVAGGAEGPAAGAALVAGPDGALWTATRQLAFAGLAVPAHGLRVTRVLAPPCD
jgi:hypothetical protein